MLYKLQLATYARKKETNIYIYKPPTFSPISLLRANHEEVLVFCLNK